MYHKYIEMYFIHRKSTHITTTKSKACESYRFRSIGNHKLVGFFHDVLPSNIHADTACHKSNASQYGRDSSISYDEMTTITSKNLERTIREQMGRISVSRHAFHH